MVAMLLRPYFFVILVYSQRGMINIDHCIDNLSMAKRVKFTNSFLG